MGVQIGEWAIGLNEYHADHSFVSHSMLEDFRESIPLYAGRYVQKTLQRKEPTPAMLLGTALHYLVLQPDLVNTLVSVAPECDRRTKAGKEKWDEFTAQSAGRTVITQEQWAVARLMADGIEQNSLARDLLAAPGRSELAIRWEHAYGLPCKARFDRQLDNGISLDIKTTIDPRPSEWVRQAVNFGYFRQMAWYMDGRESALNVADEDFLFVVVGSQPPHECSVVALDYDALLLGREQNNALVLDLQACQDNDRWQSRLADEIYRVSLPKYAFA